MQNKVNAPPCHNQPKGTKKKGREKEDNFSQEKLSPKELKNWRR
jgi:hypothetical protein